MCGSSRYSKILVEFRRSNNYRRHCWICDNRRRNRWLLFYPHKPSPLWWLNKLSQWFISKWNPETIKGINVEFLLPEKRSATSHGKQTSTIIETPKVVVRRLKDDGTKLIECASFYLNSDHCFNSSAYLDYAILKISKSGIITLFNF